MPGTILDTGNRAENETKIHASCSFYSGAAQPSNVQTDTTGDKCYGKNKRAKRDRVYWAVLSAKTFLMSFEQIDKNDVDLLYQREIQKNGKYETTIETLPVKQSNHLPPPLIIH